MTRSPELPSDRVYREILIMIRACQSGDQLPPVRQLAAEFSTSKATIDKVLRRLEAEGTVRVVRSWGTFVADSNGPD